MAKPLKTVAHLIALMGGNAETARAIEAAGMKCKPHQPRDWIIRELIPPGYQYVFVKAAHAAGHTQVTSELIDEIHAPAPLVKRKRRA